MFGLVGSDTVDINDNNGPLIIRTGVAMMCLSALAVGMRFFARRLAKQPILWDDWTILMTVPWAWAVCITQFIAVDIGKFGRHIQLATPESVVGFFKMLYVDQAVYLLAIAGIKFSIILFYRRIFNVSGTKIPLIIIGASVMAWLIATLLVGFFSCVPVNGFWEKHIASKCIDTLKYFFGVAIPNISTDVVLLLFPIPLIWKLHMPTSQKIAIIGIFALGGFIIVISSLRLVTVIEGQVDHDFTWVLVPLGIWNVVETNIGILLACLPSMAPLLRLVLGQKLIGSSSRKPHSTSKISQVREYWPSNRKAPNEGSGSFTRLNNSHTVPEPEQEGYIPQYQARANAAGLEMPHLATSEKGIQVKSSVQWESHPQ